MGTVNGLRSFAAVRSRASSIEIDSAALLVATLADIIASKRAARRPRDLAVLDVLEKTREQAERSKRKAGGSQARK
jgi:hypothetical protein